MNSKMVLIYSEKEGVGKSTIAGLIKDSFDRTGVKCSFYDLDEQGAVARTTTEAKDSEVVLIDTVGPLSEGIIDRYMPIVDLIIVPTRMSGLDIATVQRMMMLTKEKSYCPVLYVLNGWTRCTASELFVQWFKGLGLGDYDYCFLPRSEYFLLAAAINSPVMEVAPRGSRVREMTVNCTNKVRKYLNLPPETI